MNSSKSNNFNITKRDGSQQEISSEKIRNRLLNLCNQSQRENIDIDNICKKVINGLYPGVTTEELDNLAAEICASMVSNHIEYQHLAGRIVVSKIHRVTKSKFSEVISDLYNDVDTNTGNKSTLIANDTYEIVKSNSTKLDEAIDYSRDFNIEYFGLKTLERSYLLKVNGKIVERPQHMFMRVAIGIHKYDIDSAIETYNLMSEKWFIHATPTLFYSGRRKPQLSSGFALTIKDDSIKGIYATLKDCFKLSKHSEGLGINIHSIRSVGSKIFGTNRDSNGIIPMIQVFDSAVRCDDQGVNDSQCTYAFYLEPWHNDIFEFLQLKKKYGDESNKARDILCGLWIPDLFMRRLKDNGSWTLMDPHACPGLSDCWGDKFDSLYESYESQGKGTRTVNAKDLWREILVSQIETGNPYILYKDECNKKSNQQHLGTIKSSNLCTEVIEYSAPDEIAVCNQASISLPKFVDRSTKTFDFDSLIKVTGVVTKNLNKIIDVNYYPLEEARNSNMRHRPIAIGVQGLADAFALMRYPFDSKEAAELNKKIFETIYFGALKMSCELAKNFGTYESYEGSPISKGILQPDMWNVKCSDNLDWPQLRKDIAKYGVRNSLLMAPMPTASTSQILGNNECFEAFSSNIDLRKVMTTETVVVNRYLLEDLVKLGVWSDEMKEELKINKGSIKNIDCLPNQLKQLYKTVWEIPQSIIIDMAADRAPFIDQSQSMNLYVESPTLESLSDLHNHSWEKGLKTGMYCLKSRSATEPTQFTNDKSKTHSNVLSDKVKKVNESKDKKELSQAEMCSLLNRDACESCQG